MTLGRRFQQVLTVACLAMALIIGATSVSFSGNSTATIQIGYQPTDSEIAKRLAVVLSEPGVYRVTLAEFPLSAPFAKLTARLTSEPNLFLLTSPAQAASIWQGTDRGIGTAGQVRGRTIHAVTLNTYGAKIIDDTDAARMTWAKRVVSAGSTDFQVGQARLLFEGMRLRCVDQGPTSSDSIKCTEDGYWDQPARLIDGTDGTQAFLVWGEKCEGNVRRVHQLRPRNFLLIPISPLVIGRLRRSSQLPYAPDKMEVMDCTQESGDAGREVPTGTLMYSLNQSSRPRPEFVSFIARRTARLLLESFPRDELVSTVGLMDKLVPFLPQAAEVYAQLGLIRR